MNGRTDRTNGFEDGRDYMRVKKSKLAAQNDKIRESLRSRNSTMRTDLFKGISINVNGRTQPTADELKRLILLNGGEYHPYYRYQTTKFMIATNLSTARIKTLRPDDRIVRPEWITESVQAKCLLPYQEYQLFADEPRGESGVVSAIAPSSSQSPSKKKQHQMQIQELLKPKPKAIEQSHGQDQSQQRRPEPEVVELDLEQSPCEVKLESAQPPLEPGPRHPKQSSKRVLPSNNKAITMSNFVVRGTKPSRFPTPKVPAQMKPMANICGKTQIDDIISLLNEWVGCPEGITDEDTACVTKYFYDLMSERNYHNKFYEIISALHQRIVQYDERDWVTLYNSLVSNLKNELNQSIDASQNLYQLIAVIKLPD